MLLPIGTERRLTQPPLGTLFLLAFQIVFLIPTLFPRQIGWFLNDFGFVPLAPTWYGPITSMFVHGGIMHFLGNALYLWVFGSHLEDVLGFRNYLLLYLLLGLGSLLSHVAFQALANPVILQIPLVGASGAIAGLMGLFAIRFWGTRVRIFYFFFLPFRFGVYLVRSWGVLLIWFLLQLLSTFFYQGSPVAYFAHIGGFLLGVAVALMWQMTTAGTEEAQWEDIQLAITGGKLSKANTLVSAILGREPENIKALQAKAEICLRSARFGNPAEVYRKLLRCLLDKGSVKEASEVYQRAYRLKDFVQPEPKVLLLIARYLEKQGESLTASDVYIRVIREGNDEEKGSAYFYEVQLMLTRKETAEARSLFDRMKVELPVSPFTKKTDVLLKGVEGG